MKKALSMIEALSTPQPSTGGQIDGSQLMIQINMLKESMKLKAEKIEVVQARQYSDDQIALDRKDWTKRIDQLSNEIGHFRTDFENFRAKDFMALEARVTALEKRLSQLTT